MSGIKFVSPAVAAGAAEVATVSAKLSEIKTLEKKLIIAIENVVKMKGRGGTCGWTPPFF